MDIQLTGRSESLEVRGWLAPRDGLSLEGPTYVIIHGVGLSHRVYGRLARRLSRSGSVVAVDLPGFGGLRRPTSAVSVADSARVVARLLARMNIQSYIAIGHSMGAQIALELAIIDQPRVAGLVMIGPVVNPRKRTLLAQAVALARDSAKEPPATNLMVLRDYLTCGMRWYLTETLEMMKYRSEMRIDDLTVPLLVIRGENDVIAPSGWCAWLAGRKFADASQSIPGQRHVVAHSDPATTAALIADFAAPLQP
jgi:pimeloyl-ACP methyl ester carboxylesterase